MKKFRVYDKGEKRYSDRPFFTDKDGNLLTYEMIQLNDFNVTHLVNADLDRFIIEYSTGLTDAKGQEIYEGDYNKDGTVVVFCDNCLGWQFGAYDTETGDMVENCHYCNGDFFFQDMIGEFKVVGNIHGVNLLNNKTIQKDEIDVLMEIFQDECKRNNLKTKEIEKEQFFLYFIALLSSHPQQS